jgi:bacteriophage exclusion system BrxA-like protein
VTDTPKYTTQLQAGLGLVPETFKLLAAWEPGMSGQDLFKVALASGDFPAITARRLQNVVTEAFRSRYLTDSGAPAKLLKAISNGLSRDDFRSLCFLFTCRANPILADFVRTVYWPRYATGAVSVSKMDSLQFVSSAVSDGRTTCPWSETTVTRVASYLLGACVDFGLLGVMKAGARPILTFRITPKVASILAHDLHFRGLGDNALLQNPDWGLFGFEPDDVLGELKRLSLRGELIVQSAGGLTQVSWKLKSMEELADGIAKS